jgi:hypothetical protein
VPHIAKGKLKLTKRSAVVSSLALCGLLAVTALLTIFTRPHLLASKHPDAPKSTPTTPKHPDVGVYSTPQGSLDLKGSGSRQTKQFTASAGWDLVWSYDCFNLKGEPDRLFISVLDGQGHVSADTPPVMEHGSKGSGVKHYQKAGAYFLSVMSRCTWHTSTRAAATSSPSISPGANP